MVNDIKKYRSTETTTFVGLILNNWHVCIFKRFFISCIYI